MYIGYTLYPDFFRRNGFVFLLYSSLVLISQYIYCLVLRKDEPDFWAVVLGIDNGEYSRDYETLLFRLTPASVSCFVVLLCFIIDSRAKFLGRNQKHIDEEVLQYNQNIFEKCPKIYKWFVYSEILLHRIIALACFAMYITLLLKIERSILNLISLILIFTIMCIYLS